MYLYTTYVCIMYVLCMYVYTCDTTTRIYVYISHQDIIRIE